MKFFSIIIISFAIDGQSKRDSVESSWFKFISNICLGDIMLPKSCGPVFLKPVYELESSLSASSIRLRDLSTLFATDLWLTSSNAGLLWESPEFASAV